MKSLTKPWFDFKNNPCNKNNCRITERLFWKRLDDPSNRAEPLFLAVNSLSGAMDLFRFTEGTKIESAIASGSFEKIDDYLFQKLKERGYLFQSKEAENIFFFSAIHGYKSRVYEKNRILGFFAIDTGCSMGCEYCFEKQYEINGNDLEHCVMTEDALEEGFKIITTMRDIQGRSIDNVAGWGGEPLRENNYILNKKFIELAKQYRIPVSYFTSLAEIGNKSIQLLIDNAQYIKFLSTTIDGLPEKHNQYRKLPHAFEKTEKNIDILLAGGVPVIIRTNIGIHNIDSIPYLAEYYYKKGWFDYPQFKSFLTHTYDRHHVFTKEFTLTEDQAVSKFLELRDMHPLVRKIQILKYGPSLSPIINAFKLRETNSIIEEDFELPVYPSITYCNTANGCEYVFTGGPEYSLYTCAECTALSKFKIGTYYPKLKLTPNGIDMWNMDTMDHIRSFDTIESCRECRAATFCGGYCGLEAITANGNSNKVYCKKADEIIENFLHRESHRLYRRAKILIDQEEHITL